MIPVLCVDNNLKGPAGYLVVCWTAGCRDGESVSTARKMSHIELLFEVGPHGVCHRAKDAGVMVGTEIPFLSIRTEALGQLGNRLLEAFHEKRVAARDRIRAESPIGRVHPADDAG